MIRLFKISLLNCLLLLVAGYGQVLMANDDFLVFLDQSWSMKEKVPGDVSSGYEKNPMLAKKSRAAVEAIQHVVDDVLKEGDYFALIAFGNNARLLLSQEVNYRHEREIIKESVRKLSFEDRKTDIVAGIRKAGDLLLALDTPERRKILVMITDGRNDPPVNSPYSDVAEQDRVYEKLKEDIHTNNWRPVLVGLGAYTDIEKVAKKLGLPKSSTVLVGIGQNVDNLRDEITNIIQRQSDARITMSVNDVKLRLRPQLMGGYETAGTELVLKSTFFEAVKISLRTNQPVSLDGTKGLEVYVEPLSLQLSPNQSLTLKLTAAFAGKRPDDGSVRGVFSFHFSEGSTPFYPNQGTIEVILPSWWEFYGLYTSLVGVLIFLLLAVLVRVWRRSQVLELRVLLTSDSGELGEAMRVKKNETFTIAAGQAEFAGRSFTAKGLSCNTAARIRYLGHRRFDVMGEDAELIRGGELVGKLTLSTNEEFDLRDGSGKTLRNVMIIESGAGTGVFGTGNDTDVF